jgi:hypothetical protein
MRGNCRGKVIDLIKKGASYCPSASNMIYINEFLSSSLVFSSFKKFSVLVLAHLLLTPFFDVSHSATSVEISPFSLI